MKENYKETNPKEYQEGYLMGEFLYEQGYSREYVSTYSEKFPVDAEKAEQKYAYNYGIFEGYEEAEAMDYKTQTNLNQEDYEKENYI